MLFNPHPLFLVFSDSLILEMLFIAVFSLFFRSCFALQYDPAYLGYNLNTNEAAIQPKDYWGEWGNNHTYNPSPENWRFPFYALTIDRFVDGDPTNNDANGTVFETHWMSNQFRFGGDVAGIGGTLDYLQGLGIKAIYFTGSMMLNMPWSADGYGPLDFTLLDQHHGAIEEWQALITEIHSRGMYVIFDNTVSTMGNLLGYEGQYENTTVTFNFDEYPMQWKVPGRRYHDFDISNERNNSCQMPPIWETDGLLELSNFTDEYHGCMASEFDQYGDIESTGAYPSYINQFSRFASVQDRLREWMPNVLEKINVMSCMQIAMFDIDGFRVDKAVQVTVDALTTWANYQRDCAKRYGKENFLIVGEVVTDPRLGSVYFGRGKEPDQELSDPALAVLSSGNETDGAGFIRELGFSTLDGASFDYDLYGSMTRFLGLDGPWGSLGVDWVEMWNTKLASQDMVNSNTGIFDPRHLSGMTNQDVFRWPALANGTQRQMLGFFVTILEMPGIPLLFFGEEQEFYALENTAPDYVFGRTPMVSNTASQIHGCYGLGEKVFVDMPYDRVKDGCHDDTISLDHRDPSHPLQNILKRMFELRLQYPVLNDGFNLTTLSTRLYDLHLPGSGALPSPMGIWSVYRGRNADVQDFNGTAAGNLPVWLLFHNQNQTVTYEFSCKNPNTTSEDSALVAAFAANTTVKNLFYPYETYTLEDSEFNYTLQGLDQAGGCISAVTLRPWEFKAFVPESEWVQPKPVITWLSPSHDERVLSNVTYDATESVQIEIGFSENMNCSDVANSLTIASATQLGVTAVLNMTSVACSNTTFFKAGLLGEVPTTFSFHAELTNVANGVHTITVDNPSMDGVIQTTQAKDKFMFRIGAYDNPMVFKETANFTKGILQQDEFGDLYVATRAAGADKMRYSTNWGSSWSQWQNYTGQNTILQKQNWTGTKAQEWDGEHVILQYWSQMTGSTDHIQHSDLNRDNSPPRRWPHAWVEGVWNNWGFDAGIENTLSQNSEGEWTFNLFSEWPTNVTINVWGMNPDGQPDKSAAYGDVDMDGVLDWLPPDSISNNVINISTAPPKQFLGWKLVVNDGNYNYSKVPYGSAIKQIMVMALLCVMPVVTAVFGVLAFMGAFYKVKFNKAGTQAQGQSSWTIPGFGINISLKVTRVVNEEKLETSMTRPPTPPPHGSTQHTPSSSIVESTSWPLANVIAPVRRKVLIATMEYEIAEWYVKIKIGGLGVMASLMGKNLTHQDLIWVVPCCGEVDYPFAEGKLRPLHLTGSLSN